MSKIPISLDEDFERELQNLKKSYSYDLMKITGLQPKQLDFAGYIRDFCESNNLADSSVDGTSNQSVRDIVSLENDISKPIFKMIALNKIYVKLREKFGDHIASEWLKSEYIGKAYLHDAHTSTFIPYCYAYDLTKLATEGLFFLNNGAVPYNNKPASHLDSFVNHVKEFVSFCCNRQAGAVGLPNIMLWMYYFLVQDIKKGYNGCSPFVKDDIIGLTSSSLSTNIKYFKQCVQSLIYALNQPYLRNSIQSAFTNVSIFDHEYAHALFDGVTFPDGTLAYDCIDDIVELQKVFMQTVAEIREENMFTFPVLTISLLTKKNEDGTVDFVDEDFAHWASDHNCKWNDSNIFMDDSVTSLSNCCRLKSDISAFMNDEGYFNSIGGTALSVGSVKVNTVNLAHIAYESITKFKLEGKSGDIIKRTMTGLESFYLHKLKLQVEINLMALDVIRDIIITNKDKRGLLPNISDGLIDMTHMYNTIGVIGVYETIKAFQNKLDSIKDVLGLTSTSDDSYDYLRYDSFGNIYYTINSEKFVQRIFKDGIQGMLTKFKKEHKLNYSLNCEQIPGETAASKLMSKDAIIYPDLVVTDLPMYGNQFIPLGLKATHEERVRVAVLFDGYLNGGSITHLNFESPMNKEQAWRELQWLAQKGLTYSAFTTKISACKNNHAYFGSVCPHCGEPTCTTYARIVGFYTPTGIDSEGRDTGRGSWSSNRKEEFKMRQWEK